MERKQNTKGESQWGISSAGRAPALHAGGQEFESPILHHLKSRAERLFFCINNVRSMYMFRQPNFSNLRFNIIVIRHLKLKCLTHKMINFKFEPF